MQEELGQNNVEDINVGNGGIETLSTIVTTIQNKPKAKDNQTTG